MALQLRANENASDEEQQLPEIEMSSIQKDFGELLNSGLLTDINVVSGSVQIRAHKSVLAARVPFFKEALLHDKVGKDTIEVSPKISVDTLKLIIDYAYCKSPKVNLQNAQDLLEAAAYLGMEDLFQFCDQFVAKRIALTVQDCLTVQSYARVNSATLLAEAVGRFIAKHFADIIDTDAFKRLSESEIKSLLNADQKDGQPDESLFWEALVKWIEADVDNRKPFMPELLGLLRLPTSFNKDDIILKVLPHPFIDSNPVCRQMIQDLLSYKADPSNQELRNKCAAAFSCLNRADGQESRICMFYSYKLGSSECNALQVLPSPGGKWTKKFLDVGYVIRAVRVGDALYCATNKDKLILYTLSSETWSVIEGDEGRPYTNWDFRLMSSVNGKLVGCEFESGSDNNEQTLFCCCYDPSTNSWQRQMLNTPIEYMTAGICGVRLNGKNGGNELICISTYCQRADDDDDWLVNLVLFDMHSGTLVQRGKPIRGRVDNVITPVIASYREKVFVDVGDVETDARVCVIKAYDVMQDEWSSLPDLNVPRNYYQFAVVDDRLYVIGGRIDYMLRKQFCSVEYLDLTDINSGWKYGPQLLDMENTREDFEVSIIAICLDLS